MSPAELAPFAPESRLEAPDAVPQGRVRLQREPVRSLASDAAVGGVDEVREAVASLDLQADRDLAWFRREVVHAQERRSAPAVEDREHRRRARRHDLPLAPADLGALLPEPDHPRRPPQERAGVAQLLLDVDLL